MGAISWLFERMSQWQADPALVRLDQVTTYGQLLELVAFWQDQFSRHDIRTGRVVALCGDYTPKAVALLLALVDRGAIVVPLTEATKVHHAEFLDIAEAEMEISFDEVDGWVIHNLNKVASNSLTVKLQMEHAPGLVLFSSGSTGKSKATLHNFICLLEKFKVLRQRVCTLTFLLLDHMGGINTLLYALSNGGTVVSVSSRDPEMVCQIIGRYHVELLPTSPTFLNLLLISEAYKKYDLSSLKLITYGTEVMPESTLRRVHELFPNIRLQQTYGLSEVGVLRSKSKESGSLWVKIGGEGFEIKVIDGILWVRAQSAMLGYLNAPSPFDADGWMNTGDIVEVDGEYIRILGRKSEIINVGGQKVYPAEVENVLMQMSGVVDVVVYQYTSSLLNTVAAKIRLLNPEALDVLKKRVRAFCKDKLVSYKIPVRIEIAGVDENLFSARYKKSRS